MTAAVKLLQLALFYLVIQEEPPCDTFGKLYNCDMTPIARVSMELMQEYVKDDRVVGPCAILHDEHCL